MSIDKVEYCPRCGSAGNFDGEWCGTCGMHTAGQQAQNPVTLDVAVLRHPDGSPVLAGDLQEGKIYGIVGGSTLHEMASDVQDAMTPEQREREAQLLRKIQKIEAAAAANIDRFNELPDGTEAQIIRKVQKIDMELLRCEGFIVLEEWLHDCKLPTEQIIECLCTLCGDVLLTALTMAPNMSKDGRALLLQQCMGHWVDNLIKAGLIPPTPPRQAQQQGSTLLGPNGRPIKRGLH